MIQAIFIRRKILHIHLIYTERGEANYELFKINDFFINIERPSKRSSKENILFIPLHENVSSTKEEHLVHTCVKLSY